MNSKQRDVLYGVKPRNIEHKVEELPKRAAKKPYADYCKRLKREHVFTLADVRVSKDYDWNKGNAYITALINRKEYRCEGCQKKKIVREVYKLDIIELSLTGE